MVMGLGLGLWDNQRRFNPVASLLPGASVLAVYDPSDMATLFQDRAGTVPVTAPGQLVGQIRDKGPGGFHRTAMTDAARATYQTGGGLAWLEYAGAQAYSTATVTPGVDKAQVFAGVRKQSDAGTGILFEIGASPANGTLSVSAPGGTASPTYRALSQGTVAQAAISPASFVAPTTNALTALSDISGDTVILRVNGGQVAQSTGDQGTGNFGPWAMFFGARSGTGGFFTGREYGTIVRFSSANLDAGLIARTERSWIAPRTGVVI